MSITLTELAANKIKEIINEQSLPEAETKLRVAVKGELSYSVTVCPLSAETVPVMALLVEARVTSPPVELADPESSLP